MRAGLFQGATNGTGKVRRIGTRLACFLQNAPHDARKVLVTNSLDVWDAGVEGVTNLLQSARGWVVARDQFFQSAKSGGCFSMALIRAGFSLPLPTAEPVQSVQRLTVTVQDHLQSKVLVGQNDSVGLAHDREKQPFADRISPEQIVVCGLGGLASAAGNPLGIEVLGEDRVRVRRITFQYVRQRSERGGQVRLAFPVSAELPG